MRRDWLRGRRWGAGRGRRGDGIFHEEAKKDRNRKKVAVPVNRMAWFRKIFPDGPAKGDVQSIIDYDRGKT